MSHHVDYFEHTFFEVVNVKPFSRITSTSRTVFHETEINNNTYKKNVLAMHRGYYFDVSCGTRST